MANLFTLRIFARNLLRGSRRNNICYISFSWSASTFFFHIPFLFHWSENTGIWIILYQVSSFTFKSPLYMTFHIVSLITFSLINIEVKYPYCFSSVTSPLTLKTGQREWQTTKNFLAHISRYTITEAIL